MEEIALEDHSIGGALKPVTIPQRQTLWLDTGDPSGYCLTSPFQVPILPFPQGSLHSCQPKLLLNPTSCSLFLHAYAYAYARAPALNILLYK